MQNKKYIFLLILVLFIIILGLVAYIFRGSRDVHREQGDRVILNYEERQAKQQVINAVNKDTTRVTLSPEERALKAKLLAQ